ncbi:DUF2721 domain-containing protein [Pelagicoccus mobilis]|uniref:DUF2721 domain-containing protein n=1 Tax=Pelagicoccus mobilis TaxID=415221 RepID=A0A934VN62_9BACT|nr:DUF2721 domain-containing protein [Pelagicoccus mobilis]MBK1879591.1 DUF2721 domain-containing protein [Pelagicoccus mobilis]
MTIQDAIEFINASLAPAVLLTGVGLLLAGLQSKYSTIAAVIRQLNAEKRESSVPETTQRLSDQIASLMVRAKLIRNAIFCFYLSVFFVVSSSIALGFSALAIFTASTPIFALFGVALFLLFLGLWYASREALLSYRIVQLETCDD